MARIVPDNRARLTVQLRKFDDPHALIAVSNWIGSEPGRSGKTGPRQTRPNQAPIHRVVRASRVVGANTRFALVLERLDQHRNLSRYIVDVFVVNYSQMRYRRRSHRRGMRMRCAEKQFLAPIGESEVPYQLSSKGFAGIEQIVAHYCYAG